MYDAPHDEHSGARNANAFQWRGNPPKLPLTIEGCGPPSNSLHGYFGPPHLTRHLDPISRRFTAHAPLSLYFTIGWPLPEEQQT